MSDFVDAELLEQAQRAAAEGRYREAAAMYEEGASRLIGRMELPTAASVLVAAGRLYALAGELAQAEALLEQVEVLARENGRSAEWARARAELADQRGDSALRRRRWSLARDEAAGVDKLHALARLADEARERDAVTEAAAHLATAVEYAERLGEERLLAATLLELATVRTVAGEHRSAEALLNRAEASTDDGGLRAKITAQRGVIALAAGRLADALTLAEQARAQAVAVSDVHAYLASAQLIVLIHQNQGREIEALDTLLRTRESLRGLLGDSGAAMVQPALDTFAERLGPEAYGALHAQWVARQTRQSW